MHLILAHPLPNATRVRWPPWSHEMGELCREPGAAQAEAIWPANTSTRCSSIRPAKRKRLRAVAGVSVAPLPRPMGKISSPLLLTGPAAARLTSSIGRALGLSTPVLRRSAADGVTQMKGAIFGAIVPFVSRHRLTSKRLPLTWPYADCSVFRTLRDHILPMRRMFVVNSPFFQCNDWSESSSAETAAALGPMMARMTGSVMKSAADVADKMTSGDCGRAIAKPCT